MSLFAAQLVRIQWFDASSISAQAMSMRRSLTEVPAARGEILDSNGTVLARSVQRYNLTGDPTAASDYLKYSTKPGTKGIAGVAEKIESVLGGDANDIEDAFNKAAKKHTHFTYLAKDISPAQWGQIRSMGLPGISKEGFQKREYPQGSSEAPLLGWVNYAQQPGGGVELMMQHILQGKDGERRVELSPNGDVIATGDNYDLQPVNGRNVALTINNDIQFYTQNQLAAAVKSAKALSGEAVVSDRQGNILAAASYPSFDNNDMSTATTSALQNGAFTDTFEPGSTQKALTIGSVLEQGSMTPTSQVVVPNRLKRAGREFRDAENHGTENLTLAGVVAQSSNIGTMEAGEKVPRSTLYSYMQKAGLGQPTGIGYPGESVGIVPPVKTWKDDTWYTMMFGQGIASSPMQQIGIFQAIANGGMRVPLRLVKSVQGTDGTMQAPSDKRKPVRVFSSKVSNQLIGMMEGVVTKNGTSPKAQVPGYSVAGKTATAQRYDSKEKRYDGVVAGFIGMAPAQDPQLIVSISIQKPQIGEFGGEVAAPVFSKVMGYALANRRIPPSKQVTPPYPTEYTTEESSTK